MLRLSYIICIFVLTGCAGVSSVNRPANYYSHNDYPVVADENSRNAVSRSLFSGSNQNLSEPDIKKLLDYRLALQQVNRIAIVKLNKNNYRQKYSSDFVELDETIARKFINTLRNSERVYDASYLPGLLLPETSDLNSLRKSAARFQADLILIYESQCRSFSNYRLLSADQSKSYCQVESILVDTRTGIVPFTMVSIESYSIEKSKSDFDFRETRKKSEMVAIGRALADTAGQLVSSLKLIPKPVNTKSHHQPAS